MTGSNDVSVKVLLADDFGVLWRGVSRRLESQK
jgi:hypothetical protein